MDPEKKFTEGGIEIQKPGNPGNITPSLNKFAGADPITHNAQPGLSSDKLQTTQQKVTFFTAEETNRYYHSLLQQGVTELNLSFDRPTKHGHDSDHADAEGEIGKLGVNVNSLLDMEILFRGIRLQDISIHIGSNPTGFILLAFIIALAKKQGADLAKLRGSIQNDILQEYITGGNYIYPIKPSMRIIADMFEWCTLELPNWNIISVSGYHIRETGSTAEQEIAFALSNGKAYVKAALERGLNINRVSSKLSFLFGLGNNLFEEVAKLRAAKRLWADIMKEFGATDEQAMMLHFNIKTSESILSAGESFSDLSVNTGEMLHAMIFESSQAQTNGYGKTPGLKNEEAKSILLNIREILAYESGVTATTDLLAGNKFMEALTDEVEKKATELITIIDSMGGSVIAIEKGFMQGELRNNVDKGKTGIIKDKKINDDSNNFYSPEFSAEPGLATEKSIRQLQIEKLESLRRRRNPARCDSVLQGLNDSAAGDENIMPAVMEAVENNCTLGEIADTLREVYGEYKSQV